MRSAGLFLGACLLATTGCASTEPETVPVPLDEVKAAVTKTLSTTAQHIETQDMGLGTEGAITWASSSEVDAPAGNYRVVTAVAASPSELGGYMLADDPKYPVENLTTEVMRIGDTVYLSMRSWPERFRGRWLSVPVAQAAKMLESQGAQAITNARSPSRLLSLVDSANTPVSRTGAKYQLTIPAWKAVSALGAAASRLFVQQQLNVRELEGDVSLEAVIDGRGRIESMRVDASGLMTRVLEMAGTHASSGRLTTTVSLRVKNFDKPMPVVAPSADKLIDPSEMGR